MSDSKYYLEMEGITYQWDDTILLNNISLAVARGEFLVVASSDIGGKTSFLKLCSGLVQPAKGTVRINGKRLADFSYNELQAFRRQTGFVFQDGVLISNLSVKENIALPLRYHSGLDDKETDKRVEKYLESLNLKRYANERPATLSLEAKLLANLARALVVEPDLLLLDELFSELNRTDALMVINRLKEIKSQRRITCLMTTNTVNLLSSFPEAPLVDCLIAIEAGSIIERGECHAVRDSLIKKQT